MKEKNKLIVVIVIVFILALFSLVIYFMLGEDEDTEIIPNNIDLSYQKIEEDSDYFLIQNLLNNYYIMVGSKNTEDIYNVLNNKYIIDNNITIDNILDVIKNDYRNVSYGINSMKLIINNNLYYYFVNGYIQDSDYEEGDYYLYDNNVNCMVILNKKNKTYSIYPLYELNDYSNFINNYDFLEDSVMNTKYDSFNLTGTKRLTYYLARFTNMLYMDSEKAYGMLEEEFKKEKYSTYEDFINDRDNIYNRIKTQLHSFLIEEETDDYVLYKVIDKDYNIIYIYEYEVMNYTLEFEFYGV